MFGRWISGGHQRHFRSVISGLVSLWFIRGPNVDFFQNPLLIKSKEYRYEGALSSKQLFLEYLRVAYLSERICGCSLFAFVCAKGFATIHGTGLIFLWLYIFGCVAVEIITTDPDLLANPVTAQIVERRWLQTGGATFLLFGCSCFHTSSQ